MPKPSAAPTQDILDIDTIRDGVVVLKNGGIRAVLMCSSLNFELKSEVEQDAIVAAYQDFLNSFDFQVQYVIHSRRLDIDHYLERLAAQMKEQPNELLRVQSDEYIQFIRGFVEMANIMQKLFYVVVPFALGEKKHEGLLGGIRNMFGGKAAQMEPERFREYKAQLWQRVDLVISGLSRLDIRAVPLKNEELVELFRSLYRPGVKETIGAEQLEALGITSLDAQEASPVS